MIRITQGHSIYKLLQTIQPLLKTVQLPIQLDYPAYPLTIEIEEDGVYTLTICHPDYPRNQLIIGIPTTKAKAYTSELTSSNELAFYVSSDLVNVLSYIARILDNMAKGLPIDE